MSYFSNALRELADRLKEGDISQPIRYAWSSVLMDAALRVDDLEDQLAHRVETNTRLQKELDELKHGIGQLLR